MFNVLVYTAGCMAYTCNPPAIEAVIESVWVHFQLEITFLQ